MCRGNSVEIKRQRLRGPRPLRVMLPAIGAIDVDNIAGLERLRQRLAFEEMVEPGEFVSKVVLIAISHLLVARGPAMFSGADIQDALTTGRKIAIRFQHAREEEIVR